MRNTIEGANMYDNKWEKGVKFGVQLQTAGADVTMDEDAAFIQVLTLTGAGRKLLLPAASVQRKGLTFLVLNTSASALDITVRDSGDTTTFGTISQNEGALITCTGATWITTLVGTST